MDYPVLSILLYLPLPAYILMVAIFWFQWHRQGHRQPYPETAPATFLSVVVAARNEAHTIPVLLQKLDKQHYPSHLYEILVIDDHSEDDTAIIAEQHIQNASLSLRLLRAEGTGKKSALRQGIREAKGKLIVTTDADCIPGPFWLQRIEAFYRQHNLRMVLGPVAIEPGSSLFGQMQSIEFASLVGSGAASLQLGIPSMCNGANLAFDKETFLAVGGYSGTDHLASGDDEFLMHKIAHRYPESVRFLFDGEAAVSTRALPHWHTFVQQRLRWASKWPHYQSVTPRLLAGFVFIANLSFLLLLISVVSGLFSPVIFLITAFLKFFAEFVFLRKIVKFCGQAFNTRAFAVLEIFYPIYVSFFAIYSKRGKYIWKGRKLA